MRISPAYSIARVKRLLATAEQFGSVRAARVRIACRKWLGTWGGSRPWVGSDHDEHPRRFEEP